MFQLDDSLLTSCAFTVSETVLVSGGTLNTWCSGYGVELKNVPIPKVTCSIPVQTECKTSGSFSETAGESQSKDLHSLASALCGNSSNR